MADNAPWLDFAPQAVAPAPDASQGSPWLDFAPAQPSPAAAPRRPGFNADGTPDLSGVMGGPGEAAQNTPAMVASQVGDVVAGQPRVLHSLARGLPFEDRAEALVRATGGAITGQPFDYSGQLGQVRNEATAASAANPVGEGTANFIGSMAMPLGALGKVVQGATTTAKVARGAVAGGILGGVQGVSSSPDLANVRQVAGNAVRDAAAGAFLGGVIPATGAAAGSLYRRALGTAEPAVEGVGGAALRTLNKQIDASGGAPVVQQQLGQLGPDARLLDASPALGQLATGVATGAPGTASNRMVTDLQARQAQAPARLNADITSAMGPFRDAQQMTDALDQQKAAISSALPAVYQHAPPVDVAPILSTIDSIKAADGTPLQSTLAGIRRSLTQDASAAIPQLPANPTAAEYRQWQQATQAAAQASGRVPVTDAQTLHRAKQAIDAHLDYAGRGLGPLAGADATSQGIVGNIRGQLDGAMRQQVPGYAQTMDRLSSLNQQQEAIQRGAQESLRGGQAAVAPYQFQRDWNAQSQAPTFATGVGLPQPAGTTLSQSQIGQQIGMRDAMERAVGTNANDLSAARTILQGTPDPNVPGSMVGAGYNLQNIGTAFGRSKAQILADAINRENRFAASNQGVYQGSQTGTRLAAQEAAKPPEPFQLPGEFHNITGPVEAALGAAHGSVNALIRAMSAGKGPAYTNELASALSAPGNSKLLAQVLANNSARTANRAAALPVVNAVNQGAGITAAAAGALLAQHERQRQLQNRP